MKHLKKTIITSALIAVFPMSSALATSDLYEEPIHKTGESVNIDTNVHIQSTDKTPVDIRGGSKLKIDNGSDGFVKLDSPSGGMFVIGSEAEITTGELYISTTTGTGITQQGVGSSVEITASKIVINTQSTALLSGRNGGKLMLSAADQVDLVGGIRVIDNGELGIDGEKISIDGNIRADNESSLNIGQSLSEQTTIKGNITSTSKAHVSVSLGTGGSLKGRISQEGSSSVGLDLGSGSTWNMTGNSNVNTISGNGNIMLNGENAKDYELKINTVESENLFIGFKDLTVDDFSDPKSEIDDIVSIGNLSDSTTITTTLKEGDIKGAYTQVTTKDGTTFHEDSNTKLDAFSSVAALSALSLRHEMNSLSKRMGELRDTPAGVGAWVRGYGSEMEYGSQNVTLKSNSIQMGSDYTIGDWKVGAAFSYTDADSSYDHGSADNKSYGVGIYGTWFVPCGAYVDLIAKYNLIKNDFAMGNMNGSYDSDAYSISAEMGYRFEFIEGGAFVEPQIGISYGRIEGETLTASNGVKIEQDNYDSLIGRVGVRTGFKFPKDKGSIYARVSGVYDFQGEMTSVASKDGDFATLKEDLGGAWLEMGVGANFNWTKNTYTYIDLERTNGGEVKENYRWNIGIRHNF